MIQYDTIADSFEETLIELPVWLVYRPTAAEMEMGDKVVLVPDGGDRSAKKPRGDEVFRVTLEDHEQHSNLSPSFSLRKIAPSSAPPPAADQQGRVTCGWMPNAVVSQRFGLPPPAAVLTATLRFSPADFDLATASPAPLILDAFGHISPPPPVSLFRELFGPEALHSHPCFASAHISPQQSDPTTQEVVDFLNTIILPDLQSAINSKQDLDSTTMVQQQNMNPIGNPTVGVHKSSKDKKKHHKKHKRISKKRKEPQQQFDIQVERKKLIASLHGQR